MINDNIGIVVLSRIDSQRLYQKAIQKINNLTAIEILFNHLLDIEYPIILAIPSTKENDVLFDIAQNKGIEVYRSEKDIENECPTRRLLAVAEKYKFSHVVRITHDDILIDKLLLTKQIYFHIKGNNDYTYMSRCPEGIAGEIIRTSALKEIVLKLDRPCEFPCYYFKKEPYAWKEFYPPYEYQYTFRLTMDYEEDLLLLKILHLYLPLNFGTLDLINFLNKNRYLLNINHLPLITIYTCVYNCERFIEKTLHSIITQDINLHDIELIIIDDDSKDKSLKKIVEWYSKIKFEYQKRIKILSNTTNKGLTWCSNKALELARGRYIIRVDADDVLNENALSYMLQEIQKESSSGFISGYKEIDENDKIIKTINKNSYHPGCCLLIRKCVNDIKYREDIKYFDGVDFFDRFEKFYKLTFNPIPLWNYRRREGQKTSYNNLKERNEVLKELADKK